MITTKDSHHKFLEKINDRVIPYFNQGRSRSFKGIGNIDICFHEILRGGKDAIVVLPGRTEPFLKYSEVVFDLDELGHDFFLLDHRGQGLSGRMLNDRHKGYVENFNNYVEDLDTLIKLKDLKNKYDNIYLVAHSMGAAIALWHHIQKGRVFSKMVLSSPMVEIETGSLSHLYVEGFMRYQSLIGKSSDYSRGSGPGAVDMPFKNNKVTGCPSRFQMARNLELENNHLIMGGPTNNWVLESLKVGERIFKQRQKLKEVPMLFFQAGSDQYSKMTRQNRICESLDSYRKVYFPKSLHEMFQEKDSVRNRVIDETISFLSKKSV